MNLPGLTIDRSWTLFLDRDGVINRRIVGDYVKTREQFEFIPGVPEAIATLSARFGRVIVVTNQQGVGKGLMTDADVNAVHRIMTEEIERAGGRIDAVYYSPHLESDRSFMRKPAPGMALRARRQFPGIVLKKAVMAGDTLSDMIFGKRLGITTVLIAPNARLAQKHPAYIDFVFPDLLTFAGSL
jgi:histidinol-phosphate phosphatase family protein